MELLSGLLQDDVCVELDLEGKPSGLSLRKSSLRNLLCQQYSAFDIDGAILGRVVIKTNSRFWHNGVKIKITQSLAFLDQGVHIELCSVEEKLLANGWMEGVIVLPFSIDLFGSLDETASEVSLSPAKPAGDVECHPSPPRPSYHRENSKSSSTLINSWQESYEGITFSIRHHIEVCIQRPWYSYPLSAKQPFTLFKITQPTMQQLKNPVTVVVPDCGGKCIVELQSRWVEIGSSINVSVTFQNLKRPITSLYFMLIKAEFVEDVPFDKVVLVHRLFGVGTSYILEDTPEDAVYFEGFRSRVDEADDNPRPDDAILKGAQFELDLRIMSYISGFEKQNSDDEAGYNESEITVGSSEFSGVHMFDGTQLLGEHNPRRHARRSESIGSHTAMMRSRKDLSESHLGSVSVSDRHMFHINSEKSVGSNEGSCGDGSMESGFILFTPSFDTSNKDLSFSRIEGHKEADIDGQLWSDSSELKSGLKEASNVDCSIDDIQNQLSSPRYSEILKASMATVDQIIGENDAALTLSRESRDLVDSRDLPLAPDSSSKGTLLSALGNSDSCGSNNLASGAWRASLRDTVAVRYYLRVVVQDAFDRTCWNTTELMLFRGDHPFRAMNSHSLIDL